MPSTALTCPTVRRSSPARIGKYFSRPRTTSTGSVARGPRSRASPAAGAGVADVVEIGSVDDVFEEPRMPYTIGLLGSMPRLDSTERQRLTPIKGSPPSLINPPPGCPFGPRCPLHFEKCDEAEPPLVPVEGVGHVAACWRSEELSRTEVDPAQIFGTDASDTVLAAASEIGERAEVELGPAVNPATVDKRIDPGREEERS